jgi:hypothetical protein
MYRAMRKLARLSLGVDRLRQAFLLSLPFCLSVFVYHRANQPPAAIAVTGIASLYFFLIQYMLYRKSRQADVF